MKDRVKFLLHKLLGFDNYLFIFSVFKILTLKWDRKENDFFHFLRLIPQNTSVLDIGANVGVMTVHLARRIRNVQVIAFEPIPCNRKALERIVSFFGLKNIEILGLALGDKDGEAEMVMPVVNHVRMQGLSHMVHESIPENNAGERFSIPVKKLDHLDTLLNTGKKISAIKMDVENFEYFVLNGAHELIRKFRPLIYTELWDNENRIKCFDLMKNMKYSIQVLENGRLTGYMPLQHFTQNFFFVPQPLTSGEKILL